ncbi:MAG: dTDP-4-dehydrorhamnose reductase [Muribaculaceae bacterium]|nr:dTDP-4-dehydrorhamnose reductase [Muribaculaceae bacterium]
MKILITGSQGQLGTELNQILTGAYPAGTVVTTDIDSLDLTDAKAVKNFISAGDFSHIINCAAYTAVDKAEIEKSQCTAINVDAVSNLAGAAADISAKLIHISTDFVFDGNQNVPYKESDKTAPLSMYGATKRRSETVALGLNPDTIVIRTGWLYSPHGSNFVKTILRLATKDESIGVVYDQIGTPTYARDLANMIATIIAAPQWLSGIYNYSNEGVASWYDFARAIIDIRGLNTMVKPLLTNEYPTQAKRPAYSVLDKNKIKATYQIEIPYWRDSLAECLKLMD